MKNVPPVRIQSKQLQQSETNLQSIGLIPY